MGLSVKGVATITASLIIALWVYDKVKANLP